MLDGNPLAVAGPRAALVFPPSLLISSLELSDTKVYQPEIRALLETNSHFCEVIVFELRTLPRCYPHGGLRRFPPPSVPGGNLDVTAPHKCRKLTTRSKMTFDERVALRRVDVTAPHKSRK